MKPILERSPDFVFPSRELQMGVLTHTELQDTWSELLSVVAVPVTPEGHFRSPVRQ